MSNQSKRSIPTKSSDTVEAVSGNGITLTQLRTGSEAFLEECRSSRSPETASTYQRALKPFLLWMAGMSRERFALNEELIQRYKNYLSDVKGLQQVSVSTYLTAVRRFMQHLVDTGAIDANPARGIKGNRRPVTHNRGILSPEDVETLLRTVSGTSLSGLRDQVMVRCMLRFGMSEIELVRADVEDLRESGQTRSVWIQAKGRKAKDQLVELDPDTSASLDLYLSARDHPKAGPLFPAHSRVTSGGRMTTRAVRMRFNRYLTAAGLKRRGITPHSLVHTAAATLLRSGLSLEEVKVRMRHGTLDTTEIIHKQVLAENRSGSA